MLVQEMLHVFKCDLLIDCSPASGYSMLAVLLSNLRGVAICRNRAHSKFLLNNLSEWVRARGLCPGFQPLQKPQHLKLYEAKAHGRLGEQPLSQPTLPKPTPVVQRPLAGAQPTLTAPAPSTAAPRRLAAFGNLKL